ncbi:MAG: type II toxin-antitoxin system RelE/ParE family toxin [Bacteroidota bacterium]
MAYNLRISPEAFQEATDAVNYYESIRPGLGAELLLILEKWYIQIAQSPFYNSFVGTSAKFRDVKIERFPYVIVYAVKDQTVTILSVRNTHRKPYLH